MKVRKKEGKKEGRNHIDSRTEKCATALEHLKVGKKLH